MTAPQPGPGPDRPGTYRLGPGAIPGGGAPPPGRSGPSRLPIVLTVVLAVLAVAGAVALFAVVKPDPDRSATGAVKAMLSDLRDGRDADRWRCSAEIRAHPGNNGLARELGVSPTGLGDFSVHDEGKVRRIVDDREGTAVRVRLNTGSEVDLFVVEQDGDQRVCGIGSLGG